MPDFGVIQSGFRRKRYIDILSSMQSRARANFGDSINTDTNKPFGKFLDIIAWQAAEIWEELEETYQSISIDSAEGIELDRLVKYKGLRREILTTATGRLQITGTQGTLVPLNFMAGKINGVTYSTTAEGTIEEAGVITLPITSNYSGSRGNADVGEINQIVTPITGVNQVTNIYPIVNGQDFEGDIELRERYLITVGGLSTLEAIRAAVAALDGVISTIPVENTSMEIIDGQPPKSIQVFVYGGDDRQIAQAILDSKAGGIEAFGQTYVTVQDVSGFDHEIGFTRAEVVNINVSVTIHKNQFFLANGIEQIKSNILRYIGGIDADGTVYAGLKIGAPVINSFITSLVWPVGGITDVSTEIKTDDMPAFTSNNILVGKFQIARTSIDSIEVVVI